MNNKKRILISCNMEIQHFYFVKCFLDTYLADVDFYILFQSHLNQKLTFIQKLKKFIKKSILKGWLKRFISDNHYSKVMNEEKKRYYSSYYPHIELDYFYKMIAKDNILISNNINSKESIDFLKTCNPDLLLLQGGKLIKNEFLSIVNCHILHLHLGIVPIYRGGNSQFWSIYNNSIEENGFTIQSVDLGIDTGAIYIRKYLDEFFIDDTEHSLYCRTQTHGIEAIKVLIKYYLLNNTLPKPVLVKEQGFNYSGKMMTECAKEYVFKNRKRVMTNFLKNENTVKQLIPEISVI